MKIITYEDFKNIDDECVVFDGSHADGYWLHRERTVCDNPCFTDGKTEAQEAESLSEIPQLVSGDAGGRLWAQVAALCEDQLLVAGMFLPAVMLTPRVSLAVCLDMWLNVILDASVRVFGDEINI